MPLLSTRYRHTHGVEELKEERNDQGRRGRQGRFGVETEIKLSKVGLGRRYHQAKDVPRTAVMTFRPERGCTEHPEAEEHRSQLKLVFGRIQDHGLISSPAKCQFGLPVLHFLGHWGLAKGVVRLPSKVQVGAGFPHPSSVKSPDEGPMRGRLSPRWFMGGGCVLDVEPLKS